MNFSDVENEFFYAVIYGILHKKLNGMNVRLENVKETLGDKLFFDLKEIEQSIKRDHPVFNFFDRCQNINEVLLNNGYFLRFYERRNKFRCRIRKKLKTKNESRQELSSCVIQKFIGYEILRNHLMNDEKKDYIPIDIVYEPTLDDTREIDFYFAYDISLAFFCQADKFRGRNRKFDAQRTRQRHFCNNYFVKSFEKMQKHISVWSDQAVIIFSFENRQIISYQDNYSSLGDLSFSVYYHFETTNIGYGVFFDEKMFVISYCIIVAFHPEINLPRIVIYRSFDQTKNELQSLVHFEILENGFFQKRYHDLVTLKQLHAAANSVSQKENNNILAEMFDIELKFTVDCVMRWFNKNIKSLELDVEQIRNFRENNPFHPDNLCCFCNFPLNSRAKNGWSGYIFKTEHLFLENIYN